MQHTLFHCDKTMRARTFSLHCLIHCRSGLRKVPERNLCNHDL